MAKRRTKDHGGGAAVADPPAGEATTAAPVPTDPTPPMSAAEVEAIKKELEEARRALRLLEKRNKRIIDAEKSVESWKRELDRLTESINETRKAWKDAVERLQREIKRQEAQNELPFDGEKAAAPAVAAADPTPPSTSGATKLDGLAGLSESLVGKLASVDVATVSELEAYMDAGKLVPGRVKGLGQAAIDKITDALLAFRQAHPKEGADDRPKRCGKPECKAEYPGELAACPTCGETVHERVDPAPTPPEVTATEAAKADTAADHPGWDSSPDPEPEPEPAADGAQGSAVGTDAQSAPPEAGTVFDPASGEESQ